MATNKTSFISPLIKGVLPSSEAGVVLAVFLFAIFAALPLPVVAQTPETSLLLHFNENFDYNSVNVNRLFLTKYANRSFSTFDTAQKKFGSASLKLVPSTFSMVSYSTPIQSEPLIGDGDSTLDFWMYPINISDPGNGKVSPILLKDMYDSISDVYIGFKKNGQVSFNYSYKYDSGRSWSFVTVDNINSPVIFDSWNHLVLQRKGNKLNLAINGSLGQWKTFRDDAVPNRVNVFSLLSVPFFEIYFDEVRITNGAALWGNLGNGAIFSMPTEETISAEGSISAPISNVSCSSTVSNGYTVPAKNHGENVDVQKTQNISNGVRISSTVFSCSFGSFLAGAERDDITCNNGYVFNGTQCIVTSDLEEAPAIIFTDPGGQTFSWGDEIPIRWTVPDISVNSSMVIKLFNENGDFISDVGLTFKDTGSFIWKTWRFATPSPGKYFVQAGFHIGGTFFFGKSELFIINLPPAGTSSEDFLNAEITNVTVAAEDRGLTTVEPGSVISVKWNTSNIPVGTIDPKGVLYVGFFNEENVEVQKGFNYPWVWNTGIRNFFLSVSPGRYYIKVCLPYSDIICGRSNWITVNPATITVSAPAVGSAFNQKADIPVTWVSSGLSLERGVYIGLYKANGDLVMEDYKPNSGAAALALSNAPPLPGDYYIKVGLIGFQGVFGQSNPFTITGTAAEAARITVTAPAVGSTFDNKARIPVAWTSANFPTGARVYVQLFDENDVRVSGVSETQKINIGSEILDLNLLSTPLFQGRYYIEVNLSGSISAQSALFTITGPIDVTGVPSSLLLHFDEATPPYKDSSGNVSAVTAFDNVALPSSTTTEKKFGAGAISFNGKKEIEQQQALAVLSSANGNLSFGDDDFTIDFWVSPDKLEDGTILFYLEDESGDVNKRLTLFVDSTGWLNLQSGSISLDIESGLEKDAWNHIAIQRKKVGTVTFLGLSVNGKVGNWTALDSTKSILLSGPFKIIGFGWPFSGVGGSSNAFEGVIDEFRVVKGRALWGEVASGDSFTLPSAPAISVTTITLPNILGGEDVQPETATTPERPVSPVSSEAALSREEKIDSLTESGRLGVREMLIKKVNGDRNYTVYFDANDEHLKTIFWEDNTSDKKLKEFEYDASGGLYREKYYNRDVAETDIISYYPRAEGGGIKQEVKKRQQKNESGALIVTETLSGFDAGGRMIHTQQYRGEELLFAKTFSYDGDNLTSDLFYAGVNNWEKNEYEYENTTPASGDGSTPFDKGDTAPDEIKLKKITNTRRLPAAIEGSASVISQTTSLFENGKLKSARRISAPIDVEANKVEDISYRVDGQITLIDIFDFEHNVKTHIPYQEIATGRTAPEYEYAVRIDSASSSIDLPSYTRYKYDAGALKSKDTVSFLDENVSKFGTVTAYSPQGKKIRETILTYQSSAPGEQLLFSTQTVRYFDEAERVALEQVFYYRDGEQSPYQLKHFNDAGLVTMVADIENNNFATKKLYYGSKTADADNQWFEVNYLYGGDAPLTMEHYYVGTGAKVLSGSGKYRYNEAKRQYELIAGSAIVNKLAKKELGDAIVSSLSLTTTDELPKIAEAVEKILRQYQGALSALVSLGSTSRREVEELYVKFARKATYAIYSIEYKTWTDAASLTKDLTKGLIDDRALENVATEWVGIDRDTGLPFKGLYIFPRSSATKKLATDAAFVDFSEGGLADSISKAGSYEDLKSIATKSEKWDALPVEGAYEVKIKTGGQMVVYNEVSGGYLTVDELTKRDPSIMLLVDRLFADLEAKAVTMSGSGAAAEKETIKKVYEYFFNKSLFTYLWDLGGTTQTVGQTFARGGGNSGDFAAVFLSVLREVFYRLGNSDIQTRLSSAPVMVSAFAPISAENIGAGHGGTTYEEPAAAGGKLYYIEPSYLFKGGGTLYYDNILLPLTSSFPLDGKDIPMAQTNAISDHNWYVALDTTNAIQGVAKQYRKTSLFTPESPQAVSLVSNSSEKVASIPSYIEPYDENVNDLANYFIRYIPDMDAHSPEFIAEYIHSEFSKLTEYEAETKPNDVWKRVSGVSGTLAGIIGTKVNPILSTNGTLSGNKITGDCEDLAFAEASVLQNILTKYYMRRGYTAYNAAAKAQSQVFLLAERNYEGDATKDPHLYVAFVTEPRGTSGTTIMILDPQDGSITPALPFEIVLNDNYLFYANSSKVSAVSFYDWSALRLSAAVGGTLQQAIDAVSGVRPATDFKFSEKAQNYIQELQTKTGQAARNEITLMSEETANQTLADPNATFADKEAAAQAILIMSGSEVSAEPLPPKEASDFPQKTATAVANFLKKVNQAVKSLIGTVIPGYGAPRLPPTGKTYSGEPVNPYDIIPDPNFDYYSAVGNQEIIDPSQTLDNLEYYSAIGNTVLRTEQREPSAEIPTVPPPTFVFTGVHTKDPGIRYNQLLNRYEVDFYRGEPGALQCKSQYYMCTRDSAYNTSYTRFYGNTKIDEEGNTVENKPKNSHWQGGEGACSTTEFSCDKRVYYEGWECDKGWKWKDENEDKVKDPGDSCEPYTVGDPLNSPPTQPQICGPKKGLPGEKYEYSFESEDSDKPHPENISDRQNDAKRQARNEPYLSNGTVNPLYKPADPTIPLPFDDWTNGKLFYDIKIGARLIDNFSLPPYDVVKREHSYTASGKAEDTKKTALLSWSDVGTKEIKAFAKDSHEAASATSELAVTIGSSDFTVSGTAGACSVGPADGVVTVNWAAANANTLAPDGFYLYRKLAGEDDAAFARVADAPLGGVARSYAVTGLDAGAEYVFAVAPFVSNNCGGTFTLATTTASVSAPARCPMPDLKANAPALSDEYGNFTGGDNGNVLGAGEITIRGTVNNRGAAATANGAFKNRFDDRVGSVSGSAPGSWDALQTVPLVNTSALSAGATNRTVKEHTWTGGIGTWDFLLTADTNNEVTEENEENNISDPITVEIVDFTPTLAANSATALAGDTIAFTASAVRQGNVENPQAVAFSNPLCGAGGTMVSPLTASTDNDTSASFSCTYGTPGTKTATVSASYYKIPKTASANVTITLSSSTVTPTVRACAATAVDAGKVTLNWLDVSGEEGYRIYKWDTNDTSVLPPPDSTVSADVTTQTITDLTPGSRYYFKVASYSAAVESLSSVVSSLASEQCPDLIVEPGSIEMLDSAGNVLNPPTAIAPLSGNSSVSFHAKIRNQGGATAETFKNQFSVDGNTNDFFALNSQPSLNGLGAGALSVFIPSSSWTISTERIGSHTLEVCADVPPVPEGVVKETPNETNNCRSFPFTVISPLSVNLGGRKANTADTYGNTVIVDYEPRGVELKWTTTGSPTTCAGASNPAVGSWNVGLAPVSPGGSKTFTLPSIGQLLYTFTATCSRP